MLTATSNLLAVAGVFGIGLIIGLVVLTTAEEALTAVAKTAARDVSGSFWVGLLWQLLAVPLLAVMVVACALTIIGILVIPIAALAWALAYTGAFTLGVLAVALVIGRALAGRGSGSSQRSAALRGLTVGLATLSLIWFGAAIAAKVPVAGAVARLIAVASTWAVATVGLGAVVKSRMGVAQLSVRFGASRFGASHFGKSGVGSRWGAASTTTTDVAAPGWQTPTPVQGVVAARRPVNTDRGTGNGAEL
ncbi:MAG: hypothetical protein CK550_07760 [Gemmatimonadetes bacterium]|nr:MAG: hypothetical protein CK550_07760 [Gemmatimonadota bacterium]